MEKESAPGCICWNECCTAVRLAGPNLSDATFEPDSLGPGSLEPDSLEPDWGNAAMAKATLSISSKNYSSWCLRGYLLCKLAGLEFDEEVVSLDDPGARAELLLLSPSFLVPCLTDDGVKVWDTLAIAEYLAEAKPNAGLLPTD